MLRRQNKLDVYNRIEISKKAIAHNIEFFQNRTSLQIIPVLKSNAYGHGLEQVAKALRSEKLPFIAVDGYFEALRLRKFIKTPILVMGMIRPNDFKKIDTRNISFFINDEATVHALGALKRKIRVHLEINTGMNRYGVKPEEVIKYIKLIQSYPKIELEGVLTHLADPDSRSDTNIQQATSVFDNSVEIILANGFTPKFIHIGQSASVLRINSRYANAARIGLSLYGINPFDPGHALYGEYAKLKPALKLISTISKVNFLGSGDKVGYNYTFTAKKPMKIAILPLGYYEGINHKLGNKGAVKFRNKFLPIVGKVCMNHTMVDLKDSNATAGDEAVIISDESEDPNSISRIAADHNLFVYSLLVSLSPDVRRILV